MTSEEFVAAQAKLNELETASSEARRTVNEGIETARAINGNVRVAQAKLRQFDTQIGTLKAQLKEHLKAEQAKAEAAKETVEA